MIFWSLNTLASWVSVKSDIDVLDKEQKLNLFASSSTWKLDRLFTASGCDGTEDSISIATKTTKNYYLQKNYLNYKNKETLL